MLSTSNRHDDVMIVGPIMLEGYEDRSSYKMMWFFGIGCRIDQAGIARPAQPNKQPHYIILELIQRESISNTTLKLAFLQGLDFWKVLMHKKS